MTYKMTTVEKIQPKLKDWCIDAHNNATNKGFWNNGDDPEERIALLHSEISEAFEDYRNHKMELEFLERGKPVGLPSEVADICIRIFDLYGRHSYYNSEPFIYLHDERLKGKKISNWIYKFHRILYFVDDLSMPGKSYDFQTLDNLLGLICMFCDEFNIDLENAIEVKIAYNLGRPHMHGGKAC